MLYPPGCAADTAPSAWRRALQRHWANLGDQIRALECSDSRARTGRNRHRLAQLEAERRDLERNLWPKNGP